MNEIILKLALKSELELGTLYHFGKLGLLTGEEFWEAVLGTIDEAGFVLSSKQTKRDEKN